MLLDTIVERNREYLRGRKRRAWPPNPSIQLAVVACYDPRLDDLIRESIGIGPGEAFVFRSAGAFLREGSSSLRSLAVAIYLFGVTDVLVMGHRSCRMASFDTEAFIDAFRGRGVPREAFGHDDLREWAGAIPDPKRGVQSTVANLVAAPFLPRDLRIAGVVLDDETGALEVAVRPGEAPGPPIPGPAGEPAAEAEVAPALASAPPRPVPPAEAEEAGDPLVQAATNLERMLRAADGWRSEVRALQTQMARQHPVVKLDLLEKFLRRTASDSREVARIMAELRHSSRVLRDPEELLHLVLRRGGET